MASKLCLKRLNKEILMYQKEKFKFPNLILRHQEDDILLWYFIVYDLKETPFENGVYFEADCPPNNMRFASMNPNIEYFFKTQIFLYFFRNIF